MAVGDDYQNIFGFRSADVSIFMNMARDRQTKVYFMTKNYRSGAEIVEFANEFMDLVDTPGILWPKFEDQHLALNLASMTVIKEEILNIDAIAVHILRMLSKYYPNILSEKYGVSNIDDINEVLEIIGRKRGCLMKGNIVDIEKVYTIIINDLKEGKIGKVTFDR